MRQTAPPTRMLAAVLATAMTAACSAETTSDEDAESSSALRSATAASRAPTSAPSSPALPPSGWERIESLEGGVAISLPRGWEAADLSRGDVEAMTEFLDDDPRTAPLVEQLPAMIEQDVALFAVTIDDAALAAGFATNLNVIVQRDIGMSLDLYVSGNVSFVEETFDVDVAQEDVKLPIGDAVRAEYEARFGAGLVHQTQYYAVVESQGIIVTFSRPAGDEFAALEEEFAAIIATLETVP